MNKNEKIKEWSKIDKILDELCQDKGPMNKSTAASCCHQMGSELPPGDHIITREMLENMAEFLKDSNLKSIWLSPTETKGINSTWINNGSLIFLFTVYCKSNIIILNNETSILQTHTLLCFTTLICT